MQMVSYIRGYLKIYEDTLEDISRYLRIYAEICRYPQIFSGIRGYMRYHGYF
jgi:hypothetical protein